MKKLSVLFCFIFSVFAFSQSNIYFGKKKLVSAEIILENGTAKKGFLQDFQSQRFYNSDLQSFGGIEKLLKYETKQFKFKEEAGSAVQLINIDDVKRIIVLNTDGSERLIYDKMKLRTINSKNEVVDLDKTVILPLEQEGKLNLYGITVAVYGNSGMSGSPTKYLATLFIPYLKSSNSEYAYLPFDINRMNIFNLGKLEAKFKKALEESTKDCPEFQSDINETMKLFEKRLTKDQKQMYYDKEEKKKQIRKNTKDKAEEDFLQMKIDAEYGMEPYLKLVEDYNKKCNR
ncbi:hypothetical protein [uncultured Chryseobacterium sp.]|uniref:hypothetical protein n=1 Tax=uncultured Chryseobacterium sp. TaxID=259322 RepID=UPI0025E40341|nr:hypothetical protein [uncultured Chryseobacterium sp.]